MTTSSKPVVVGLTGSIGCGKSEAARFFAQRGAAIIDADLLAREVVAPGTETLTKIATQFGPQMLTASGELNRQLLGSRIFSDPAARTQLEDIVHPEIRQLFFERLAALVAKKDPPSLIVYVVPLFFESRFDYDELDAIIVVSAPKEVALGRIVSRDGVTREIAEQKYASQIPIEQKMANADYVLFNDSDLPHLDQQIASLIPILLSSRKKLNTKRFKKLRDG